MYILPSAKKNTIYKKKSAQRSTTNTEAYRNQIGTAFHTQHRSIQEPDRHSVPHPTPKHTQIGLTTSRIPVKQQTETILGTASHTQHRSIQTKVNTLPSSTTKNSLKKAQGCAEGRGLVPLCGFLFHKKIAPTSQRCKS